jgi:histidinol-phosphate aminotransferase
MMMDLLSLDTLQPQYVKCFEPYSPSKPDKELMKLYGCKHLYRLNNNENPIGPPPASQVVISNFVPEQAAFYPSGDSYYLRQELSRKFQRNPDQFLVGNGANEVITFVIKAFCEPGDNIVTADKTFAVYEWVARFSGIEARLVPLKGLSLDGNGMLKRLDKRTKVIFICNPNNPTGSYWDTTELRRFLDAVDAKQIVVIDEAYSEFVEAEDYPDGLSLLKEYPNLVVFRTFSKMYGLAGLRIGYLASSVQLVKAIKRTCVVYSVNVLAQEAALAALQDDSHIFKTRNLVREGKAFLKSELGPFGFPMVCGEGNFVMIKLPMSDTLAYRRLMQQGVMVRTMSGFRFPNHIRVTIGMMDAMEAFVKAIRKIIR